MQRAILEKDILYQTLVDISIDNFTRAHHIVQREIMLYYNQSSYFLFTHADTCHDHRHDFIMLHILLLIPGEEAYQCTGMLMWTKRQ